MQALEKSAATYFTTCKQDEVHVRYNKLTSTGYMKWQHYHNAYELALMVQGEGVCCVNGEMIRMQKDHLYLIPSTEPHIMKYSDRTPHALYHIYFFENLLQELAQESCLDIGRILFSSYAIPLTKQILNKLEKLIHAAVEHCKTGDPQEQFSARLLTKYILLTLARHAQSITAEADTSAGHPTVRKAAQYVNEHYAEELSLDKLADRFGLSKHYLCRLFRGDMGMTLTAYINTIRVQNACLLLGEGRLSISDIAERTGFSSTAYFDRQFKAQMNLTPSQYLRETAQPAHAPASAE